MKSALRLLRSTRGVAARYLASQTGAAPVPPLPMAQTYMKKNMDDAANIKIKINDAEVEAKEGMTILDACKAAGVYVPTLCHHPLLHTGGSCRLCLVEVKGHGTGKGLVSACTTPLAAGMDVHTDTEATLASVRSNLTMINQRHPNKCGTCEANRDCEFQDLLYRYNIEDLPQPKDLRGHNQETAVLRDDSSVSISRDMEKCVLCYRCITACSERQGMDVLGLVNRGGRVVPAPTDGAELADSECINCGACVWVCPVGALTDADQHHELLHALANKNDKIYVVQTAPGVRYGIAEEFGHESGHVSTGQLVTALRRLGFDYVFDTNFTADLTIMEEGTEFINRVKAGGPFPMFTSCCPAWVNVAERRYEGLLPHLSSAKSPQAMLGTVAKTYFAEKLGKKPEDVVVCSIMPCVAKKDEAQRVELRSANGTDPDVDFVLTTRELARIVEQARIPLLCLKPGEYDQPMGIATGSATLFGNTGGVMLAALRTVYPLLMDGKDLPPVEFTQVDGKDDIMEATVMVGELPVKVAVANGMANVQYLCDEIQKGNKTYHFVEMMSCVGGCVGGAGNPKYKDKGVLHDRAEAAGHDDESMTIRLSHKNPAIGTIYEEFLGEPCSHKSHHLLHTHYRKRESANDR